MKRFSFLFALCFLPLAALAQQFEERDGYYIATIIKSFDVRAGGHLNIEDVVGSMEVRGTSGTRVEIVEEVRIDAYDREEADALYERNRLRYEQRGDRIEVIGEKNRRRRWSGSNLQRHFTITVPTRFDLDLGTAAGHIEVIGVEGALDLATSGGHIDMHDIIGSIDAATSGGHLNFRNIKGRIDGATSGGHIDLIQIEGSADVATSGGAIRVRDVSDDVDAATSGGSLEIENVRGSVDANTSGGNIRIENVSGEVDVSTSGGYIRLRDLRSRINAVTSGGDISGSNLFGPIDVTTSAGDIDLTEVHGSVEANTSVGDIEVTVAARPSGRRFDMDLNTTQGDIRLTIPDHLSVTIDARVDPSSRWSRHDIYSDFPLARSDRDDDRRDRIIRSTGDLNGGGDRVYLRTQNGDIHIRKRE